MKPLQIVPTCTPSWFGRVGERWRREARTPMGGRIIRLGSPSTAPLWGLVLLAMAPMLLVGFASMV